MSPAGARFLRTTAPGYLAGNNSVNVPAAGNSAPVAIQLRRVVTSEIRIVLNWGPQPSDLDSHLSGPDGAGGRFHILRNNRNPVPFASLDLDDTTAFGPETTTVRRSPAVGGTFVPGEYRYWVHNFTRSTFGPSDPADPTTASNAVVSILQNGVLVRQFTVASVAGNPEDDIWRVVDLKIDANGTGVYNAIQMFQLGDTNDTF